MVVENHLLCVMGKLWKINATRRKSPKIANNICRKLHSITDEKGKNIKYRITMEEVDHTSNIVKIGESAKKSQILRVKNKTD